jgi:hypothetical protein
VLFRLRAVGLCGILMRLTAAITGQHGGLFVDSSGTSVRRPGVEVSCRGVTMCPSGSLQRLGGVQPGALRGLGAGRGTGSQFGPALLQLAGAFARRLATRGRGISRRRPRLRPGHEP